MCGFLTAYLHKENYHFNLSAHSAKIFRFEIHCKYQYYNTKRIRQIIFCSKQYCIRRIYLTNAQHAVLSLIKPQTASAISLET